MESLIFLTEKKDGSLKARTCTNGSIQRSYIGKDEATSPTVTIEGIIFTGVIEAKQNRDVMTADIPNVFVLTPITQTSDKRIIMKITGKLVDILIDLNPETYKTYITEEYGKKGFYVTKLKALYGMLTSAVLCCKNSEKTSKRKDSK